MPTCGHWFCGTQTGVGKTPIMRSRKVRTVYSLETGQETKKISLIEPKMLDVCLAEPRSWPFCEKGQLVRLLGIDEHYGVY